MQVLRLCYLADVLGRLLEVPELGHGVVPQSLVQRTIAKLVRDVHIRPLFHQKLRGGRERCVVQFSMASHNEI